MHIGLKLIFLSFFSFLMFLAQNQLGRGGGGVGGESGLGQEWVGVGWGGCTLGQN